MFPQHFGQSVERYAARQMMHMVNPDVGGEPAQQGRQVEVGTAVQGGIVERPLAGSVPMRIFELVLDVEQPDTE
jgi:hypothetical protein